MYIVSLDRLKWQRVVAREPVYMSLPVSEIALIKTL